MYGGVMQKCLPPREFSPPYATARRSPRQLILETDLALLQGWSLGALGMTNPL
jgi:hypothetical protein